MKKLMDLTKCYDNLLLNICFAYDSDFEIKNAFNEFTKNKGQNF
jgi:hypothetical protein